MAANLTELEKQKARASTPIPRESQSSARSCRSIIAVSDMPQLPYEVTLIHTNIVNACAMPGGQMIVFKGLYDGRRGLVTDDDEMAAVMAHEIAHVNCRHTTERMSKIMAAAAIMEMSRRRRRAQRRGRLATAIRAVFTVGSLLWIPMHSRGDEAEADRVGLFYMAKAGYDPRAAPRIWQRVHQREKKSGQGMPGGLSILATHPGSSDRFSKLNEMIPHAMEEYVKVVGSYPKGYTRRLPKSSPPELTPRPREARPITAAFLVQEP